MEVTHDDLVATAQRLLPGVVVHEDTYEIFRDQLYGLVKGEHGDQSPDWRLRALYRVGCHGAALWPPPYAGWCIHLVDVELPALEAKLRTAGVL